MAEHTSDRMRFLSHFRKLWHNADCWPFGILVFFTGEVHGDEENYKNDKSVAMSLWLFGKLFQQIGVALTRTGMAVIASPEVVSCLQQLCSQEEADLEVKFITRSSENLLERAQVVEMLQHVSNMGELQEKLCVGVLLQERQKGEFAMVFQQTLTTLPEGSEVFESQEQISDVLATKDEFELQLVRSAASIATHLMTGVLLDKVETHFDDGENPLHQVVSDTVFKTILDTGLPANARLKNVNVQSGNDVLLEFCACSSEGNLPMKGAVLLSIVLDYCCYHACIARTLLVDPSAEEANAYDLLSKVQGHVIRNLIPGKPFKDVYLAAAKFVSENDEALWSKFSENIGFGMGMEFEDPLLVINATSTKKVEAGMTVCLSMGFKSPGPGDQAWAVWIADTVELREKADDAAQSCGVVIVNLTERSSSLPDDVVFTTTGPAPASGAASDDTAASSVASLDAGPAAGEARLVAKEAPLVAKRRSGAGRAPVRGRGGRPGRGRRGKVAADPDELPPSKPARKRPAAAAAAGPDGGEATDDPHRSNPAAAPASGAASGDAAASSVASLCAGPAAVEAHTAVEEETPPARKRPATAEVQPGAVPESAGWSSAAVDEAGNYTDEEDHAPLVDKRRPDAGRAPVRRQGGRSGRRGGGRGAAAPVSPDESEHDVELNGSKPARKRPAAAAATGPDGGQADDETHRSKPAAAPAAADGDAAPSLGAGPAAMEAFGAVKEKRRPARKRRKRPATPKAQPDAVLDSAGAPVRGRGGPSGRLSRGAATTAGPDQGEAYNEPHGQPARKRPATAEVQPPQEADVAGIRRSKRLQRTPDSAPEGKRGQQAEQREAEEENDRLRKALNEGLKRAAKPGGAGAPSGVCDENAPKMDGALSVDLEAGLLLIPMAGTVLKLRLAGIHSIVRTQEDRGSQLRISFFGVIGKQTSISQQCFRGKEAGCFDEVLHCWRIFATTRQAEHSEDTKVLDVVESPPSQSVISLFFPKTPGKACVLQTHNNGLRFIPDSGTGGLDVLYSSIRHAFCEPPLQSQDKTAGSPTAFLYLRLKTPQVLAELQKATSDVQVNFTSDVQLREFLQRMAVPSLNFSLRRGLKFQEHHPNLGSRASYCFYGGVLTNIGTTGELQHSWPQLPVVVDLSDVDVVMFEFRSCLDNRANMVLIMKNRECPPVRVHQIIVTDLSAVKKTLLLNKTTWLNVVDQQDWRKWLRQVSRDPGKFAAAGGWEATLGNIVFAGGLAPGGGLVLGED